MDPVTLAIALVLMIASVLISSLMMKGQAVKPAVLSDFKFPQVEEGVPEAVVFGQAWQRSWQVLWYGELTTVKIKSDGSGK